MVRRQQDAAAGQGDVGGHARRDTPGLRRTLLRVHRAPQPRALHQGQGDGHGPRDALPPGRRVPHLPAAALHGDHAGREDPHAHRQPPAALRPRHSVPVKLPSRQGLRGSACPGLPGTVRCPPSRPVRGYEFVTTQGRCSLRAWTLERQPPATHQCGDGGLPCVCARGSVGRRLHTGVLRDRQGSVPHAPKGVM